MKDIFLPWQVKINDYPRQADERTQIRFLLRFGVLAPSAHNTQPWLFKIEPGQILIYLDKSRALGISDPTGRQTYCSLGALITNIVCAANYFGWATAIDYELDKNIEDAAKKLIVTIHLSKDGAVNKDYAELLPWINQRHSAKLAYQNVLLSPENILFFNKLTPAGLEMNFFQDKKSIKAMAQAVALGTREAFANKEFCVELSQWVRSSWSKQPDGMPAVTVGLPPILSGLIPWVIAHINTGPMQAMDMKNLVAKTPTLGIIGVSTENCYNWLRAGEWFEFVALKLQSLGFSCALMGAPTESSVAKQSLKTSADFHSFPCLFFRVGIPRKSVLWAPRRAPDECIIN